jgi:heme A synthase
MIRFAGKVSLRSITQVEKPMDLSEIHARLANTALLFILLLALWGWWRFFRHQDIHSSYWGALAIGEILILIQAALGATMWIVGIRPGQPIHILYGVISALALPAAFAITKGRDSRRELVVYAGMLLFLVGLLWRATATG